MGRGGYAHDEILLPDVFLHAQFKIVIGRRSSFVDEPTHHIPPHPVPGTTGMLVTYDRVYDYLIDQGGQDPQDGFGTVSFAATISEAFIRNHRVPGVPRTAYVNQVSSLTRRE